MRSKALLFLFLVLSWMELFAVQSVIYVSPFGSNCNSGTLKKPVNTLEYAVSLARIKHIKEIVLRKGKYYDVNLILSPEDSGLTIRNYHNENVSLYGGVPISNFRKEGNFLVVDLPSRKIDWDFRMLLVNGVIASRSRLPESGYYSYTNTWDVRSLPAMYGYWERKPTDGDYRRLYYKPEDGKAWLGEIKNAEIALIQQWEESYLKTDTIDASKNMALLNNRASMPLGSNGKNNYVVWNTKAGMRPGRWYWDKNKSKVFYWQKVGEDVKSMVVPTQPIVISMLKGTNHIRLQGLTISMATSRFRNEVFACDALDAAIEGTGVDNIVLNDVKIENTGGNGIHLSGCHITIDNTDVLNCGGTGIYFSCDNLQILNSRIEHLGVVYKSGVGIYGYGKYISIEDCEILDTPYSGIVLGCDSVDVSRCSIRQYMSVLQDGGAFQCGGHKFVKVNNNYIEGNINRGFAMGIYFDERSLDCEACYNVVVNSGIPVHCHMARNVNYLNNLFIDKGIQRINYDGSSNIRLDGNLFIADSVSFNGPSSFDKKVDTLAIDPKFRKYANPSGVSSFRNNIIYLLHDRGAKSPHPRTEQAALAGTKFLTTEHNLGTKLNDLLTGQNGKDYFDFYKIGLNPSQANSVRKAISSVLPSK